MNFFNKSIFKDIAISLSEQNIINFETNSGEKIDDKYLENNQVYFKETDSIKNLTDLKGIYRNIIKTKYEKKIIGHSQKETLDYFYLTNYFPKRYGNLNQEFIYDFKNGKNTEYYAEIFSETILNLFEKEKDLLSTTIILPVPASTKEKNEIRYKRLFELISQKTGVINGYDSIIITKNREASHILGKNQFIEENSQINFENLKYPYRIIIIDDVITTGHSFTKMAEALKRFLLNKNNLNISSSDYSNFIIGLFLAKTTHFMYYINNNLKDYISKGNEFISIKNFDIKNNIEWFNFKDNEYFYKTNKKEIYYEEASIENYLYSRFIKRILYYIE